MVVGKKTRDFEYQFSSSLAAVGMAHVVLIPDACVKASNVAKTVFSDCKHFDWLLLTSIGAMGILPKMSRKKLKIALGDEAFKRPAVQTFRAQRQVSIAAFRAIRDGTLADPEFAAARDHLIPTWGVDKVHKSAQCFQVGVFTTGIVSTQRVEGIHRWTKEGRLNKKKIMPVV